jgi:hypothetical protein
MVSARGQATDSQIERDTCPKGALFCPNCSHRSPYDGDWTVIKSGRSSRYLCPDCRTEVTTRAALGKSRSPFDSYDPWQMWGTNLRLLRKVFWI